MDILVAYVKDWRYLSILRVPHLDYGDPLCFPVGGGNFYCLQTPPTGGNGIY